MKKLMSFNSSGATFPYKEGVQEMMEHNVSTRYLIWWHHNDQKLTKETWCCNICLLHFKLFGVGGPFLVMEFSTSLARRDPIILKINLRQCSSKNMIESQRCLG
ncbi:uncharacterized protein LOC142613290 [Castanea sativa]|uniref:uncharacterized protein LOC142613290 n=1 Tax=Castanea sativa TaxID=21020 RepID=UPI003F64F63A